MQLQFYGNVESTVVQLCDSVGSRSKTSAAEGSMVKKKVIKIQFGFYLAIGKFYWIPSSFLICKKEIKELCVLNTD
jgi:hypothetical protein